MVFGMSTACFFPNVYNEDAIDLMGKMGINRIEVFFSCMAEYKKDFIKDLKERAEHWGIQINSVHAYSLQFEPMLFSAHERARLEALDIYRQVLEAAAELNAHSYVFHGPANVKRTQSLSLDYAYIAEKTQPLADLAKQHRIRLSWENVHWCWYASPDFPLKLLPLLTPDSLWLTFDLKQAVQSGYSPADYLRHTQGRLSNIHLCDVQFDDKRGYVPVLPFQGTVDFGSLKTQLSKINYDGSVILEVYSNNYQNVAELYQNYSRTKHFFCD